MVFWCTCLFEDATSLELFSLPHEGVMSRMLRDVQGSQLRLSLLEINYTKVAIFGWGSRDNNRGHRTLRSLGLFIL